jgi:hypothetical protein
MREELRGGRLVKGRSLRICWIHKGETVHLRDRPLQPRAGDRRGTVGSAGSGGRETRSSYRRVVHQGRSIKCDQLIPSPDEV